MKAWNWLLMAGALFCFFAWYPAIFTIVWWISKVPVDINMLRW